MPATPTSPVTTFVDTWVPEFTKSIAMFTGATLTPDASAGATADGSDGDLLWIEQTFQRGTAGRVWIGVRQAAGLALVESAADTETERIALLREAIDQSVKAAAQVLASSEWPGIECAGDSRAGTPDLSLPGTIRVFRDADGRPTSCTIRCEREFEALALPVAAPRPAASDAATPVDAAPLDRFAGVELPISIVLGRATLRVRDVLKLTVGSLIELDRRTTDPVEVCVNDAVIARGTVVSIRGNYGIRILEVMSQRDRLSLDLSHRHQNDGPSRVQRIH